MKAQEPALGILKMNEWGHSKMYKIECSCGNDTCAHIIDIEADQFDIAVTIYTTPKTKWWQMSRWTQIWTLLTKGYLEYETTLCLDKQVALNYAETLKSAVADVEKFQSEKKALKEVQSQKVEIEKALALPDDELKKEIIKKIEEKAKK